MYYNELYEVLKSKFDSKGRNEIVPELNLTIDTVRMASERADLLQGAPSHCCDLHKSSFVEGQSVAKESAFLNDYDIECNKEFDYYILKRADVAQAKGVIVFFHGLNEKKWDKYLPWAYEIAQRTHKAVVLFPIAFHMNRAEPDWSDRNKMRDAANARNEEFPENTDSSFINASISSRLEAYPQRVFWSGFQTYSDVISMVTDFQSGSIKSIAKDATIDLFGYSIGSFLSMIIKMADPLQLFKHSKLFCFCGGMTIDRMFPISKYIMDSRAAIKMQTTFAELLNSNFKSDTRLGHFQNPLLHEQESWFKVMLRYNFFQEERERRILEMQEQIKVMVLKKDIVAPPIEALNTFKGGYRNINVDVDIQDFDFEYSHVTPFPLVSKYRDEVTTAFEYFVASVSDFYSRERVS